MTTHDLVITAVKILARWQRKPDSSRRDYEGVSWLVEHSERDEPLSVEEAEEQKDILRAFAPSMYEQIFPNEKAGPNKL